MLFYPTALHEFFKTVLTATDESAYFLSLLRMREANSVSRAATNQSGQTKQTRFRRCFFLWPGIHS